MRLATVIILGICALFIFKAVYPTIYVKQEVLKTITCGLIEKEKLIEMNGYMSFYGKTLTIRFPAETIKIPIESISGITYYSNVVAAVGYATRTWITIYYLQIHKVDGEIVKLQTRNKNVIFIISNINTKVKELHSKNEITNSTSPK